MVKRTNEPTTEPEADEPDTVEPQPKPKPKPEPEPEPEPERPAYVPIHIG